jgi:hypothetical protein
MVTAWPARGTGAGKTLTLLIRKKYFAGFVDFRRRQPSYL